MKLKQILATGAIILGTVGIVVGGSGLLQGPTADQAPPNG